MSCKVGIFGGTFDPFTEAHLAIVKSAIDQKLVDEVHIVPTVVDYYRNGKDRWLSNDSRLEVINKIIDHLKGNYIYRNRIFVNQNEYCFARENAPYIINKRRYIDTLNQFIYDYSYSGFDNYDDIEYYTIIGTDSYKNFKTWTDWEEILKLSKLIVVNGRDGEDIQLDIPKIDLKIDPKFLSISSTKIREQYKNKDGSIEHYLGDMLSNRVSESIQYITPIFELVKKTVYGLDFRPVGINSKDWVSIIVEHNGKYLLVKQLRYGLMKDQIEFPCGMIENGEEPILASKRELQEETGIELLDDTQIYYLGKYAANPAFMNNYMHYYYVNLDTAEFVQGDTNFDEHEKIEKLWMNKKEFINKVYNCDSDCTSVFMALAVNMLENFSFN
jgi:nicotinate (nicotinamide) nucleotide adenylyltransferase